MSKQSEVVEAIGDLAAVLEVARALVEHAHDQLHEDKELRTALARVLLRAYEQADETSNDAARLHHEIAAEEAHRAS